MNGEFYLAVKSRNNYFVAQSRLCKGYGDFAVNIVAVTLENRVRTNIYVYA